MPLDYARTVALVTGGNRGLGRAFVDELLHRGATVDVAVLAERVPGLNLLINKAGIHQPTNVLNPGAARITAEVLAVNTIGIVAVTAALQRLLVQSRGAVLNVLSAGSWLSGNLAYSASKAASLSVTNNTRAILNPLGVQVTALHAGFIDTDMMADFHGPKMPSTLVARLALDGVAAGLREVITDDLARGARAHAIDEIPSFERS
jgi:NAD(P)-dependent dehydrogenase (short-subunit alcohol dehydrogenase family)